MPKPHNRECRRCGRKTDRWASHCNMCIEYLAHLYLTSPLGVRLLSRKLGVTDSTLKMAAEEVYGLARSDMTPERRYVVSRSMNAENSEAGVAGGAAGAS